MCDYSLCGLPNRLAKEGEELVVYKFITSSKGLASPADLPVYGPLPKPTSWEKFKSFFGAPSYPSTLMTPAICIPPGAQLILKDIPRDIQRQYKVSQEERVTFTQISARVDSHRDAVRFSSGRWILLQELRENMRVEVLSLVSAREVEPVEIASIEIEEYAHR